MLEQWVIDKLSLLENEKLVILADPQRMIRAAGYASFNRVDCLQGATGAIDSDHGRKG